MIEPLLGVVILLNIIIIVLFVIKSKAHSDFTGFEAKLKDFSEKLHKQEQNFRDEFSRNREETSKGAQGLREETGQSMKTLGDSIVARIKENSEVQQKQLENYGEKLNNFIKTYEIKIEKLTETVDERLKSFQKENAQKFDKVFSDFNSNAKQNREEIAGNLETFRNSFLTSMKDVDELQKSKLDGMTTELNKLVRTNEEKMDKLRETIEKILKDIQKDNSQKFDKVFSDFNSNAKENRQEMTKTLETFQGSFLASIKEIDKLQKSKLDGMTVELTKLTQTNEEKMENLRKLVESNLLQIQKDSSEKFDKMFADFNKNSRDNREETKTALDSFRKSFMTSMKEIDELQKSKLDSMTGELTKLTRSNEQKMETLREVIVNRLQEIQKDNSEKLEKMRETVDEKLHNTLEKRLGESFKLVSERLEMVHQGLGEMQKLATGVGDLKKVLSNVKQGGVWGEMHLARLLENTMVKGQYEENVASKKNSSNRVEFAIKIPSKDDHKKYIYLPLDSKFPRVAYENLCKAFDNNNVEEIKECRKLLFESVKNSAKDIKDKYIDPPNTTDFAILFLPTEGLYAEIIRNSDLIETIQKNYNILITGPATLYALLNSLQMGFRTFAIEKRSSEVWHLLGAVKTQFTKFGDVLEKTHKNLLNASKTIEDATKRTKIIEKKLNDVQELPVEESEIIIQKNDIFSTKAITVNS